MFQPEHYLDIPRTDLLSWTFGNTDYDSDKPVYIDAHNEDTRISHRQAKSYVRRLIAGLHAHGIRPGDSVCVHAFNNVYYSLAWLAIIGAGGRFVGSNPAYTKYELNHLFSITEAKLVIVEPELLENVRLAAEECSIPQLKIFIWDAHGEDIPDGFESWKSLLDHGERNWVTFATAKESETTTAALMSTSGTTGLPKAAAVSHYAQIAQNIAINHSGEKPYEVRRLLCLPLFHAFAGPLAHMSPLRDGQTTYIMKRFDQDQFIEYTGRYHITETLVVTPIVQGLLALPQSRLDHLTSLRYLWAGGAPLDGVVQHQLNQRLHPDCKFSQIWGLTEYGWIAGFKYPEKDAGSVGRLLPNTEAKILDKDGNEITDDGVRGEVLIRGPSLMTEYLGAPEATAKTIVDGWLFTGDVGYQEAGKWYIVDRAKELIKVRGWQVSPSELEACLLAHPRILDAAVIGVGFADVQVEQPRAYVVVDDSSSKPPLSDAEIYEHMGNHLAKYKSLTGGIRRVDSIPKSTAGKILKKHLREAAAKEATEQESIQHEEQPVPIDKNYFEHAEHGPPMDGKRSDGKESEGSTNGNGVAHVRIERKVVGNGMAKSDEFNNGMSGLANNDVPERETTTSAVNKKRKHAMNGGNDTNGAGDVMKHKRGKSLANGAELDRADCFPPLSKSNGVK